MKEILALPHFSTVGKASYLDMYFSKLKELTETFEIEKELVSWDVEDVRYRFYLSGLQNAVLTELLDTVGNVSEAVLTDGFETNPDENSTRFHNLLSCLKDEWTPETKYTHEHL